MPTSPCPTPPAKGIAGLLESFRSRNWLMGLLLLAAVLLAYQPVWHAGFIWDDDDYIIKNQLLRMPDGLHWIWFKIGATPQYYPLVYTMFWAEYHLWGLNPLGYHLVNVLLHAFGAILLGQVLARLKLPGAWLVAAVWALHPVGVESVAWVTERKNVLSTVFYFSATLAYLKFTQGWEARSGLALPGEAGVGALPGGEGISPNELSRVESPNPLTRRDASRPGNPTMVGTSRCDVPARSTAEGGTKEPKPARDHSLPSPDAVLGDGERRSAPSLPGSGAPIASLAREGNVSPQRGQGIVTESSQLHRWLWYGAALGLFAAGLFSKTVMCSLPATLLLVAWWKQGRLRRGDVLPLVPFFIVGAGLGLLTAYVEKHHVGAVGSDWSLTATQRCLIAGRALWFYAGKLAWPADLIFSYPRWIVSGAVGWQWLFPLAAVGLIIALWRLRNRIGRGPLVAVLVFIGTLFPALGFINIYPMRYTFVADHYQYLAGISLLALAGAGISRGLTASRGRWVVAYPVICGALLLTLGGLSWRQCRMYADIETLWRTTIARNPASWMAQLNLGSMFTARGQLDKAMLHYRQAIQIKPDYAEARYGLGITLAAEGQLDEAIAQYQQALQFNPDYADARNNLGNALFQQGKVDAAMMEYQQTLQFNPHNAEAHNNLAIALIQKGRVDEAILHFKAALQINPQNAEAENNLGYILFANGRAAEAIPHYQKALILKDAYPQAQNNLAWALATARQPSLRNGQKAVELAEAANQLTGGGNPGVLRTLAAAYAEAGRFPEAMATAQRAMLLAEAQAKAALANALRSDLGQYQAGHAFP